jgi:hypothetical protein
MPCRPPIGPLRMAAREGAMMSLCLPGSPLSSVHRRTDRCGRELMPRARNPSSDSRPTGSPAPRLGAALASKPAAKNPSGASELALLHSIACDQTLQVKQSLVQLPRTPDLASKCRIKLASEASFEFAELPVLAARMQDGLAAIQPLEVSFVCQIPDRVPDEQRDGVRAEPLIGSEALPVISTMLVAGNVDGGDRRIVLLCKVNDAKARGYQPLEYRPKQHRRIARYTQTPIRRLMQLEERTPLACSRTLSDPYSSLLGSSHVGPYAPLEASPDSPGAITQVSNPRLARDILASDVQQWIAAGAAGTAQCRRHRGQRNRGSDHARGLRLRPQLRADRPQRIPAARPAYSCRQGRAAVRVQIAYVKPAMAPPLDDMGRQQRFDLSMVVDHCETGISSSRPTVHGRLA